MTDITILDQAVTTAEQALSNFYADQITRIPNQATWDALTVDQINVEKLAEGKCTFAVRKAKLDLEAEKTRRDNFYVARTAAFSALSATYQADMESLATTWQAKEDHDFDVNYVPTA